MISPGTHDLEGMSGLRQRTGAAGWKAVCVRERECVRAEGEASVCGPA